MIAFTYKPKTQLVPGLTFEQYKGFEGISQSFLKCFDADLGGCPALALYNHLHPEDVRPPTEAREAGNKLHYYVLDRPAFDKRYAVLTPEIKDMLLADARADGSKAKLFSSHLGTYQAWKAAVESDNRAVITQDEIDVLGRMQASIMANRDVAPEIDDCEIEISAFAGFRLDDADNLQLKGRFDLLQKTGDAIIDLKSCRSANPREFAAQVARLGYDIQAAFYIDLARRNGRDIKRFGFLALDKFPPYLSCIHWLPAEWLDYGRVRYRKILLDVAEAIRLNEWPGYSTGMLEPPTWLIPQLEAVAA